jgi:hypothetical protein
LSRYWWPNLRPHPTLIRGKPYWFAHSRAYSLCQEGATIHPHRPSLRDSNYTQKTRDPKTPVSTASQPKTQPQSTVAIVPKAKTAVFVSLDTYRVVTGAFQVNIPTKIDADIVPFDEETLLTFKLCLSVMPPKQSLVSCAAALPFYLSQRIDGYGWDSGSVSALPTGLRPKPGIMKSVRR